MGLTNTDFVSLLRMLTDIGSALSSEKNHTKLLELILKKAREITHADGGTLYTCVDNKSLQFEISINTSLNIHVGGTSGNPANFPNLPLYDDDGKPNQRNMASWSAVSRQTINIENIYTEKAFDVSGAKKFDEKMKYHSQSFLTVPMTNHLNEVIGVLQLINATDTKTQKIIPFSELDEQIVTSLASQAAVTITNRQLINAQKELFDALIQLIAKAIDEKSPYTGNHCRRVPILTLMIAKAACDTNKGPLSDFTLTDDELYELEVAAWLHDCGKITTPEAVVDKGTKLERILDGIELVDARFEILKRDLIITALQKNASTTLKDDKTLQDQLRSLEEDKAFLQQANIGGELMLPEHIQAIDRIAGYAWQKSDGQTVPILNEYETNNLKISRGTLSDKERKIINNHVSVTIKMLESLPYPKNLKNIPQLAGSHHEKMDGTGYPLGLKREQISIAGRMIAIADIFEALTAHDRPYKKAMPLSKALTILGKMKLDGHIDPDLFDVFMDAKIYQHYAETYLDKSALDVVDPNTIPGYNPFTS